MLTLGIDTSNYATSLAVFDADAGEVVCDCKKFLPVKAGQLGLRQSDALFHHTAALPELMQKINDAVPLSKIQAVAVSEKPRPVQGSYMPCFLAGVNAATAFSLAGGVPLHKLTHQQGHIAAALYAAGDKTLFEKETLVFHVSGGTTDLLLYPRTGRTHQLRVHCAHTLGLGRPILGDLLYGGWSVHPTRTSASDSVSTLTSDTASHPTHRLHLHALSITFKYPTTGEELTFTSRELCY